MVSVHRHNVYPYGTYLEFEQGSMGRHEFIGGEIFAMAGGTPAHARLASRALTQLARGLPPGCEAYNSDLRVRIAAADMATYPDAQVICGPVVTAMDDHHAATNPCFVVEVTSPSTETFDRGEKLRAYWLLPSVQEVVIISHDKNHVAIHRRDGSAHVFTRGQVALVSAQCGLDVDALYAP